MEELREKLQNWKREAECSISNLKETFAYQRVIDEIEAILAKEKMSKEELTWEHHFDELIDILAEKIGVNKNTGEIMDCNSKYCSTCLFQKECNENKGLRATKEWLLSPYKPIEKKPKLTREEFIFLKALKGGYIARDEDGDLWLFGLEEPFKLDEIWHPQEDDGIVELDNEQFEFIQWEDKEAWSVKNLLKLEVEDDN